MATRLKDTDVVMVGLGAVGGVAALPLAQAALGDEIHVWMPYYRQVRQHLSQQGTPPEVVIPSFRLELGFRAHQVQGLELRINHVLRLNVRLEVGQVSETVTVEGQVHLLETDTGGLGQVVDHRRVTDLPLNGRDLAQLAALKFGTRVLDVGSGLGGPARFLAATYGCDVTGLDLMPEFCAVASELSRRTGLTEHTRFRQGNALALPFDDGAFDCVWTIQAQMNIADKDRFYGDIARVLRRGGQLVFQDICVGDGRPLDFPVPWATEPAQSHLIGQDALRALLGRLGLQEQTWRDVSAPMLAWQDANRPPAGDWRPARPA